MSALDSALDANQSRTCFLEIKKEIKTIRRGQLPFRFYANRSFVMNVISICGPKTNKTESELVMRSSVVTRFQGELLAENAVWPTFTEYENTQGHLEDATLHDTHLPLLRDIGWR